MVAQVAAAPHTRNASADVGRDDEVAAAAIRLADALAQVEDVELSLGAIAHRNAGLAAATTETHLRLFARSLRDNGEALLTAADAVERALDLLARGTR